MIHTLEQDRALVAQPTFGDPAAIAARDRLREAERLRATLRELGYRKHFDPYSEVCDAVGEAWGRGEWLAYDTPADAVHAEFPALVANLGDDWISSVWRLR